MWLEIAWKERCRYVFTTCLFILLVGGMESLLDLTWIELWFLVAGASGMAFHGCWSFAEMWSGSNDPHGCLCIVNDGL